MVVVLLNLAARAANSGMRWSGVGGEDRIGWSCVWVQGGKRLSAFWAHVGLWLGGKGKAGWEEAEGEGGGEEEGWKDGRMGGRRGKAGSLGGKGDQGAGAWVFYEVKSVVR